MRALGREMMHDARALYVTLAFYDNKIRIPDSARWMGTVVRGTRKEVWHSLIFQRRRFVEPGEFGSHTPSSSHGTMP